MLKAKLQNPALVTGLVALLAALHIAWLWLHFGGDPLGFLHLGTVWLYPERQGSNGYDGQFYYYIAKHPLHAVQFLDLPSIRLQRIFFPFLIRVVALNQHPLLPYAVLLINWASVVASTGVLALLLRRWDRSPWFALCYALSSGIPVSLQFATPEALSLLLVLLGVLAWESRTLPPAEDAKQAASPKQNRLLILASLAFACALLTREHTLYFVAAYAAAALLRADWRGLAAALAAFVPVTLWGIYLSLSLGKVGMSQLQPFQTIPFITYWIQGNLVDPTPRSLGYAAQYIVPAAVFGLLGLAALLKTPLQWLRDRTWIPPTALLLAMLGNVHLVTFLPLLGYQHQVAVSRYALGLALAAVLWAATARPRLLLWLTPLFVFSLLAYLYGLLTRDPAYLW